MAREKKKKKEKMVRNMVRTVKYEEVTRKLIETDRDWAKITSKQVQSSKKQ